MKNRFKIINFKQTKTPRCWTELALLRVDIIVVVVLRDVMPVVAATELDTIEILLRDFVPVVAATELDTIKFWLPFVLRDFVPVVAATELDTIEILLRDFVPVVAATEEDMTLGDTLDAVESNVFSKVKVPNGFNDWLFLASSGILVMRKIGTCGLLGVLVWTNVLALSVPES